MRSVRLYILPDTEERSITPDVLRTKLVDPPLIFHRGSKKHKKKSEVQEPIQTARLINGEIEEGEVIGQKLMMTAFYTLEERISTRDTEQKSQEIIKTENRVRFWFDLKWKILVLLDLPYPILGNVICKSISNEIYNNSKAIKKYQLTSSFLKGFEKKLSSSGSKKEGGRVRTIVLEDVYIEEMYLNNVVLRSVDKNVISLPTYKSIRKSTSNCKEVTFVTPIIDGINNNYTCRIYRNGTILIYGRAVPGDQIEELIDWLAPIFI